MEERKMKDRYITVYDGPSTGTYDEWIKFINRAFDKVPEKYRDSASLNVDAHEFYNSWDVAYQSPETDDEMDGTRKRLQMIEAQEKEQLRKLMEKYPDDSTARRV